MTHLVSRFSAMNGRFMVTLKRTKNKKYTYLKVISNKKLIR